jgi:AcrR family transcriptional regulator
VQAALKVFAAKGYEGASTREICRLAEVNVAAIHYYFGDKASLYREVFRLPEVLGRLPTEMDDPDLPVRTALAAFYRQILAYIVAPEQVQQMRLLFLREELQPTGVLEDHIDATLRVHEQLVRYLARAVGTQEADTALHQLAFSVLGLALVLFVQRTAVDRVAPQLLADDAALSATIDRLADHGVALVEGEIARRSAATPTAMRRSPSRQAETLPNRLRSASPNESAQPQVEAAPRNVARRSRRLERS